MNSISNWKQSETAVHITRNISKQHNTVLDSKYLLVTILKRTGDITKNVVSSVLEGALGKWNLSIESNKLIFWEGKLVRKNNIGTRWVLQFQVWIRFSELAALTDTLSRKEKGTIPLSSCNWNKKIVYNISFCHFTDEMVQGMDHRRRWLLLVHALLLIQLPVLLDYKS